MKSGRSQYKGGVEPKKNGHGKGQNGVEHSLVAVGVKGGVERN